MKIQTKQPKDLTSDERAALSHLHLRDGMMYPALKDCIKGAPWLYKAWVITALDEVKVVGWALLQEYSPEKDFEIQLYIRRACRRQGVGTQIFKRAQKIARLRSKEAIVVNVHDAPSRKFFAVMNKNLELEVNYYD